MKRPTLQMAILFLICLVLGGCSDTRPGGPADAAPADDAMPDGSTPDGSPDDADTGADAMMLVDHERWTAVAASADPFGDRPDPIDCDPQAWGTEEISPELTFFVKTQGCEYLTVSQPTLDAIEAGQELNIRLWHFDLTAPASSEAHLALRIGTHDVWEAYVPIPSSSQLLVDTWTAPQSIPAGEDIYFHVHNHGDNEYNLIEVSVSR